jgi:hypothetical protein
MRQVWNRVRPELEIVMTKKLKTDRSVERLGSLSDSNLMLDETIPLYRHIEWCAETGP